MKKLIVLLFLFAAIASAEEEQARIAVVKTAPSKSSAEAPSQPEDSAGIYRIGTAAELDWFRDLVNADLNNPHSAVLTADIDYEGGDWVPIGAGTGTPSFNGVFDGRGYSISNLRIVGENLGAIKAQYKQNLGFIGALNGTVKNLKLYSIYVKNTATGGTVPGATGDKEKKSISMGTVVGWVTPAGVIDSVEVTGEMWAYGDGQGVGGIAGNCHGKIKHSTSSVTIHTINLSFVGGITGLTKNAVTIDSVHWQGNIVIDNPEDSAKTYIGGIIGDVYEGTVTIKDATFESETVQNSVGKVFNGTVNADKLHYGVYTVETKDGKKTLTLDGDYTGTVRDGVFVSSETVNNIVFSRTFTPGIYNTVVFPFTAPAASITGATFYTLVDVVRDENGKWQVQITENTADELTAGTPYIVITEQETIDFAPGVYNVAPSNPQQVYSSTGMWSLNSSYTFRYGSDFGDDRVNVYGFAATPAEESGIKAGDFVRAGKTARIKPFRVYLHKESGSLAKRSASIDVSDDIDSVGVVIVSPEPQVEPMRFFTDVRVRAVKNRNRVDIREYNGRTYNVNGRRIR